MAADHWALGMPNSSIRGMLRIADEEVHEVEAIKLQSEVYMLVTAFWGGFLGLRGLACLLTRNKWGGVNNGDKSPENKPYLRPPPPENNLNNYTRHNAEALRKVARAEGADSKSVESN